MSAFITERRRNRIDKMLNNRTNYLTFVLEDIFQSQNASATMSKIEILGFSNIHITKKYILNPDVVLDASN